MPSGDVWIIPLDIFKDIPTDLFPVYLWVRVRDEYRFIIEIPQPVHRMQLQTPGRLLYAYLESDLERI